MTPRRWIALALAPVLQVACHDGGIDQGSQRLVSVEASAIACGRNEPGTIRCWGPMEAELGSPVADMPTRVPRAPEPQLVSVQQGYEGGCGIDRQGKAWCWGDNSLGQVGLGRASGRQPVSLVGTDLRFDAVGVGDVTRCGLARDQAIYCWGGAHLAGTPGLPVDTCQSPYDPRYEWPCILSPQPIDAPSGFTSFDMGDGFACGLLQGAAWCWSTSGVPTPQAVAGLPTLTSVSVEYERACGVSTDSEVWCWYAGSDPAPVRVDLPDAAPATLVSVATWHTCALARDGRAFCWGQGLAVGSLSERGSPTPVEPLGRLRFTDLAAGNGFTCGVTTEGAWCWGNFVGDGSGQPRPLPTRVSGQGDLDT